MAQMKWFFTDFGHKGVTAVLYTLAALIGVLAFAYPFILPQLVAQTASGEVTARATDAPLLTFLLMGLCLAVLLIEVQGQAVSAKVVATLGVLVAITAVLRFIDTAIPVPGGFSPIFAPIILAGYVFGARFGFLLGTLSLLTSALITGGIGPWLPYQMFVVGWVGLTAGWLPHPTSAWQEKGLLILFGLAWGFVFGAVMNLYFWPFVLGNEASHWLPGLGVMENLTRYVTFYLATSAVWDVSQAVGNAILLLVLTTPVLRVLTRFRDRFQFVVQGSG